MRKVLLIFISWAVCIFLILQMISCGQSASNTASQSSADISSNSGVKQPLNLSVYLDLSDRLIRPLTPSQTDRDTAIIAYLIDRFVVSCKAKTLPDCKDHFQVFFYPAPSDAHITKLSKDLETDLEGLSKNEKKTAIESMRERYLTSIESIYEATLSNKNWIGCDIWSFFNNKKVDKMCIREGYRNILVILTDGYIYNKDNIQNTSGGYTYIPTNVTSNNHKLAVTRGRLGDLEVLVLEINPEQMKHFQMISDIWGRWLSEMGVDRYEIIETDLFVNNKHAIGNFLLPR